MWSRLELDMERRVEDDPARVVDHDAVAWIGHHEADSDDGSRSGDQRRLITRRSQVQILPPLFRKAPETELFAY